MSLDLSAHPASLDKPDQSILWWIMCLGLGVFLAIHFTFVVFSNLPRSPLTALTSKAVSRYMNPYFGQTWTFFAPQPVDSSVSLIVRGRRQNSAATREMQETPWLSVSEPLVDELRSSRTSSLALVQLGLSNVTIEYVNRVKRDPQLAKPDPTDPSKRIVASPLPDTFDPEDVMIMTRTAVATLETKYPAGTFDEVQIAVTQHEFPRFSKRFTIDDPSKVAIFLVDWQKAPIVTPYCCSAGGYK